MPQAGQRRRPVGEEEREEVFAAAAYTGAGKDVAGGAGAAGATAEGVCWICRSSRRTASLRDCTVKGRSSVSILESVVTNAWYEGSKLAKCYG